jgi:cyclomaltodextrinase
VLESGDGEHRLLLALNLGDEPVALPADGVTTVLAGAADLAGGRATLAPHGWAVLGS